MFYIIVQQLLYYGQTKIIKQDPSDPLDIDQGYLTVSNKNYPLAFSLMYNMIICEHCDFDSLTDDLSIGSNKTFTIDTTYAYDFQLLSGDSNKTLLYEIQSYKFSEHGGYLLEIISTNQSQVFCTITQTMESSYYWLPIIIAVLVLSTIVFLIQVFRRVHNSRFIGHILSNIGHDRLVNEDPDVTSEINPITNRQNQPNSTNETHTDDIHVILSGNNQLSAVGVTPVTNNSEKNNKSPSKRLQSLDTFRGFSLMIMIFVNYGGKNISLNYSSFHVSVFTKGGSYWFFNHSGTIFFSENLSF